MTWGRVQSINGIEITASAALQMDRKVKDPGWAVVVSTHSKKRETEIPSQRHRGKDESWEGVWRLSSVLPEGNTTRVTRDYWDEVLAMPAQRGRGRRRSVRFAVQCARGVSDTPGPSFLS